MTIHVGIFLNWGQLSYFNDIEKSFNIAELYAVQSDEIEIINEIFKKIKSDCKGSNFGTLHICLSLWNSYEFRKKIVKEGLTFGFKYVKIISFFTAFYLFAIQQINFKPLNGNIIWIHQGYYFHIWQIDEQKAKFCGSWYANFTTLNDLENIVSKSGLKKGPDLILYCNNDEIDVMAFNEISTTCLFYKYDLNANFISNSCILNARIAIFGDFSAYLNVEDFLNETITLKIGERKIVSFKRGDALPIKYCKNLKKSLKNEVIEIIIGHTYISEETLKLPNYNEICFTFEINTNGIYSVNFEEGTNDKRQKTEFNTEVNVGIDPNFGELSYYNVFEKNTIDFKINPVKYNETEKVSQMFEEIKSKLIGKQFGCLCFCLDCKYGREIRKKFIKEGQKCGFKDIQIIIEGPAFYLKSMSLTNYKPLNGNVIWIQSGKSFGIWQINDQKGKFIGAWKTETLKTYDLESIVKNSKLYPNVILHHTEIDEAVLCRISDAQFFEFHLDDFNFNAFFYSHGALLFARISANDSEMTHLKVLNYLSEEIILKFGDEEIAVFEYGHPLPIKFSRTFTKKSNDDKVMFETKSHRGTSQRLLSFDKFDLVFKVNTFEISDLKFYEPKIEPTIEEKEPLIEENVLKKTEEPLPGTKAKPLVLSKIYEGLMGLVNIKVDNTIPETIPKLFNENEIYRNFSSPKGLALVISNHFEGNKKLELPGTKIDEKNIRQLLTKLGYEIQIVQQNLSSQAMYESAKNFAENERHKLYDSSVVVVLTHGKHDHLLGTDGKFVNIHKFLQCFNAINAPFLKGKPKLFFIQACRGDLSDHGTKTYISNASAIQQNRSTFVSTLTRSSSSFFSSGETQKQPIEADMLISYATIPNYVAWGDDVCGSWFIQSVCQIFSKHAATEDILSLLTKVNRRVAEVYEAHKNGYKQIPQFESRLQKKFYFFPGIQNNNVQ